MNTENNQYEQRTYEELREMFNGPDIVDHLKSRWISCAGYVWRAGDKLVNKVTKWMPNGPRRRTR